MAQRNPGAHDPDCKSTVYLFVYSGYPLALLVVWDNRNDHVLYVQKGNKGNDTAKCLGPFIEKRFNVFWQDAVILSTESMFFTLRTFFELLQDELYSSSLSIEEK